MNKQGSPIPSGYHTMTPYFIVDNASKAIEFYTKAFGAKEIMRFARPDGKISHAELQLGDSRFMLADEHPEIGACSPKTYNGSPIGIYLYVENVDDFVATAVNTGAKLVREVSDMFYGDRVGAIEDPFGYTWHVSTHIEDVSHEEIARRAAELYSDKK